MRIYAIALLLFLFACGAWAQSAPHKVSAASAKALNDLKVLQTKQEASKAAFKRKPKDRATRSAYIDATNKLASATMFSTALKSSVKYPGALRLYREVLKVDPANAEAKKWSQQIEAIYRSLGRPVPK